MGWLHRDLIAALLGALLCGWSARGQADPQQPETTRSSAPRSTPELAPGDLELLRELELLEALDLLRSWDPAEDLPIPVEPEEAAP